MHLNRKILLTRCYLLNVLKQYAKNKLYGNEQLTTQTSIMSYTINAKSIAGKNASIAIKETTFNFGITKDTDQELASPAELFLSSFAACVLKNVERFSSFMKFEYDRAEITVSAIRLDKPPRMDELDFVLTIYSAQTDINMRLLQKNIEKFGTIYNTVKLVCKINGAFKLVSA